MTVLHTHSRWIGRFSHLFQSLPFFGIVLFVFLVSYPPFEVETEINLSVHMLQHVLIALSGVLVAYPLYRAGKFNRIKRVRNGLLGFLSFSTLIVFWHIPAIWDSAVLNPAIHVLEHFCFFGIGLMIGIFIPMLPDNFKFFAFLIAMSGHMFYGFYLYLTPVAVYSVYPAAQQQVLGVWLFSPMPVFLVGYLYFTLTRESRRMDAEIMARKGLPSKNTASNVFKFSTTLLAIIMIVLLVGYFSITGFAIYNSAASQKVSIVYIAETPVSWNYSPQNIVVVLGVNNTVTWISHSYTQDTVTSSAGAPDSFNSGPISPGHSWSYTFNSPGTYSYHCLYHPWMAGTVTVLA
jgi:plastocyanin